MPRARRYLPFGAPLLLFAALAVFAAPSRGAEAGASPPKPPSVSVAPARTGPVAETVVVTGTLVAREEALVTPEIDGQPIVEIRAEEGDVVAPGQVLARLSRETLDLQLAQAAAAVARAESAVAQARSQIAEARAVNDQAQMALSRTTALRSGGAASAEALDQRQANARIAEARLAAAQQALALAEADKVLAEARRRDAQIRLDRAEVKAPVGGIVSRKAARIGAVASMAGEPLFRIVADGAIELEASVPETILARLREGQPAGMRLAGSGETVEARVRLVATEVDRSTRLGRVRLAPARDFRPTLGAFARGTIEIERRQGTLVPQSAVLYGPDGAQVQVVTDGIVHTRPVSVGLRSGDEAEIRAGLAPGELVVAIAGTFVRDGDAVTPVLAAAP